MKRSLVVLSVVSLVCAGVASAEVNKGDVMLDFLAGFTQQNGQTGVGNITTWFGAIRPGYALTDNIRAAVVGAVVRVDNSATVTAWVLGVSGEYVFMPANQLNPFIGAQLTYASADLGTIGGMSLGTKTGYMWGPRAGLLYTLNRTNNLFGEYQYMVWSGDVHDFLKTGHLVIFGIEHKFKAGK
jgi:hypothetical protein